MMKISFFFSSFWILLWVSGTTATATLATPVEASDGLPQRLGGNPPRLRQSLASSTRHHESRLVIEVEAAATTTVELEDFELEDSEDELDLTSVICRIVEYDVQFIEETEEEDNIYQDDEGPFHACFTDDGLMGSSTGSRYGNGSGDQVYTIIVPPETLAQLNLDDKSKSFISISKAIVNRDKAMIDIVADALVSVVDPPEFVARRRLGRRQLSSSTGDSRILVLRINYRGVEPDLTASELEGIFFGQGSDKVDVSLSSQMEACSFGQLRYQAAQGDGVVGGVAEIYIQQSVGGDVQVLENAVLKQFNADFDDDFKDGLSNVVMVMPKDNLEIQGRGWLAYGYLNGYLTVFNNQWASSLSSVAHELGHNKNLHHSGRGDLSYGDTSGYMGYGSTNIGAPASCFNAQKHFNLGWFEARGGVRRLDVSDDLPWIGYLAFFGDYKVTAMNQPVVINIGSSNPRLFLQYNRAKGINHETRMAGDSVVIVRDDGSSSKSSGVQSWYAGELKKEGDTWGYSNFHGNSDLSVRLCEITSGPPDVVRLSIILNDGKQKHTCDDEMPPICDDDSTATFMSANGKEKTCVWLGREVNSGDTKDINCAPGQEAYDVCAETCGKCTDDCEDTPGVDFFVSDDLGRKDCSWLSARPFFREKLCRYGHDAFEHCPESCNRCDFP